MVQPFRLIEGAGQQTSEESPHCSQGNGLFGIRVVHPAFNERGQLGADTGGNVDGIADHGFLLGV
ncbi:MAG: hypothetical protein C3F18_07215 [Nitrosomonadales bacterium]|nr:MAG: hypothetical protein C3F18_07215 [Nitrosomonadales bacterium]